MTDLIQRELELVSDLHDVWRALTDPQWLRRWLADEVTLELWPGGDAAFVVDGEPRTGWVEEVCAPGAGGRARLVFWWQLGEEAATRVCVEADAIEGGTRVRVIEARPLEALDLVGTPLGGRRGSYGPALVAA